MSTTTAIGDTPAHTGDEPRRLGVHRRSIALGLVVLVAAVIGLFALASTLRTSDDDGPTALVDHVTAAWNTNDMGALHELYDGAAVIEAKGDVYTGIASIHAAASGFAEANMHLRRVGDVTTARNVVAAPFEVTWDVESHGHVTHGSHVHMSVFELKNGRIVQQWDH